MKISWLVAAVLFVDIVSADDAEPSIQGGDLLAAFELNQASLESFDVLVIKKEVTIDAQDKISEKEVRQRIRCDLENDRLLSVILGSETHGHDKKRSRYGSCLIADGKNIRHDIDLYRKKSIPLRSPSSLKYCFLTQFVPEIRTIGLADFPDSITYGSPNDWREEFVIHKAKKKSLVKITSDNRAEISSVLDNPRFYYVLTFDLARNLIIHRELNQIVRSPKDEKLKKLFMFEESIKWTEINGVFVPAALHYLRLTPMARKKMDSNQRQVTFTWLAVNDEFDDDAFDVSAAESYERLEKLVSLENVKRQTQDD